MLHSLARAEMRRQDIRRKLQDTDGDLMETLRRFTVSNEGGRTLNGVHDYQRLYIIRPSGRVIATPYLGLST